MPFCCRCRFHSSSSSATQCLSLSVPTSQTASLVNDSTHKSYSCRIRFFHSSNASSMKLVHRGGSRGIVGSRNTWIGIKLFSSSQYLPKPLCLQRTYEQRNLALHHCSTVDKVKIYPYVRSHLIPEPLVDT